ncbi:Do family serine endopeptidase [Fimbriiglobus ruber]|uniref:HtrA protease/chaperone protein n=1 Tax=Fimbriiglobus ruber TaxID=1908690 RepID=A0A225E1E4_9BACT|nr:Do family serine endopeptidase [Fimbriiglobus ruber]OWK47391.1 HtrA protease/chaperone protein [Fimbriiglobus ruber]
MSKSSRRPAAVVGLGVGVLVAMCATDGLRGQGTVPVPPPLPSLPTPRTFIDSTPSHPSPPRDLLTFRDVVKKVLPGVVSIEAKALAAKKPAAPRRPAPLPPGVPEEFRQFFQGNDDSDPNLGFGSGVIIDPAGVVLTNFHVVEGADTVEVSLQDGRKIASKDIRRDPKTDLAIIKLSADKPFPFVELGASDAMEVGDRVLAVGAPFGLAGSVTHGIVSAKSRQNLKLNQYEDFLQTDAAINPGNSGGPLVNLDGQVIGICAAIKSRSGGFQGVGLAISSNLAREVARQLLKTGVVQRGYLGLSIRELDATTAGQLGIARGAAVIVNQITANSPAAKAGIKVGDVITAVGGNAVSGANTLSKVVAKLSPGEQIELTCVRDGKAVARTVIIEEQPQNYGVRTPALAALTGTPIPGTGVSVAELTTENAASLGVPRNARGVVIVSVDRGGAGERAGLGSGTIVVKVDKTAVGTPNEFATALAAASPDRGALLAVYRPTGEIDFVVLKVNQ